MNTNIININSDSNNISDSNSNKVKDSEEEKTE